MKLVFLDTATVGDVANLDKLKEFGECTLYDTTSRSETVNHIADNDIIITNKVILDKPILEACPQIKLICIAATGMNNVDLEYAKSRSIQVTNVSGYSTYSVAQTTFALLFRCMQGINYYNQYVHTGKYSVSPIFTHHGYHFHEIKGKTFGIIGMGTIGKQVAGIAQAFGAKVIYYSTTGQNLNAGFPHISLNELLSISDIVSIHCPLTPETKNLITRNELRQMPSHAILMNLGRGGIVHEQDLAQALNENQIAFAALDVFEHEPLPGDHPLLRLKHPEKLVLTPHIAWASIESREKLIDGIYNNIKSFVNS